ncbi:hypothetical protein BGZ51_004392 [Haplosporangium sp. Z 767]|nr:hypothetical protein BGZ51_004392 [Haplosporangium sp. Z 767]KAF9184010.1 hypothetical protein BGZ50_003943 [Haplosporangium sp. Z 11]
MTYSFEWTVGPLFLEHLESFQGTPPVALSSQEPSCDNDNNRRHDPTIIRGPLVMDLHLVPLDPGKPNELIFSRVPIAALRAKAQVRTEIPPGWYRLEVQFWEEGSMDFIRNINKGHRNDVWDLSTSVLASSPGCAKSLALDSLNTQQTRQVGVWRGMEAIEVTSMDPSYLEWNEFVQTVSHETLRERLESNAIISSSIRDLFREEHQAAEEFRMRKDPNLMSIFQDRLKSFLSGSWGSPIAEKKAWFERTRFPQESFRFKAVMNSMMRRNMPPDFLENELEDLKEDEEETRNATSEERGPLHLWNVETGRLNQLMQVWNTTSIQAGPEQADGHSRLGIRLEHGREIMSLGASVTWRANRYRTVSWQTSGALDGEDVLLTVELITAPLMDLEGLSSSPSAMTRAEMIQHSIQRPRLAVLTDRVPGFWGAIVVRLPTWIDPGIYQIRLRGVGRQGRQLADVSQPFAVYSDPYLYRYKE